MTVVTRQRLRRRIGGPSGTPLQLRSGELFADEAVSGDPELYYGKGNDGSGNATAAVPLTGGLRPWPSRAAFAAATIPDDVQSWAFWSPPQPAPNAVLVRFKRHPTGHACESANGVRGVPADPVWLIDHYIDNIEPGVTDCSPALIAAHLDVPEGDGVDDGGAVLSGQPHVDYRLNSTVTITKHNVQMIGLGGRTSLNLVNGSATGDVLVVGPENVTTGTDPAVDTPRTYHPVVRGLRMRMADGVQHAAGRGLFVRNIISGDVSENEFDGLYDPVALMSTANLYFGTNEFKARGRTTCGGTMLALLQNPDIPSRENTGLRLFANEGNNAGTGQETPGYREGLRIEAVDGLFLEGMNHFNSVVVGCIIEGKPGSLITDVSGRIYIDKSYGSNLIIVGDTGEKPFQRINLTILARAAGGEGYFTWWTSAGVEVTAVEGVYTDPDTLLPVTVPGCEHYGQGIYVDPDKILRGLILTGTIAVSQREALTIATNKVEGPKLDLYIDRPNRDDTSITDVTLNGKYGDATLRYRGGDAAGKPLSMSGQSLGWSVRIDTTLSASAEPWDNFGTNNYVRAAEAFWGGPAAIITDFNAAVIPGQYVAVADAENGPVASGNTRLLVLGKDELNVTQVAVSTANREYVRSRNAGVWSSWTTAYNLLNVVGTVSQSGGQVKGAALESNASTASPAGGYYERLADGIQRVHCRVTTSAAGDTTLTFTKPFLSGSEPVAAILPQGDSDLRERLVSITPTAMVFSVRDSGGARVAVPAHVQVSGRWSSMT